jgi:fructokinase
MVYTLGETVLDIIINSIDEVRMRPGGSMLNTSISLGRLGIPVSHISLVANDKASDMLRSFLNTNGVDTNYLQQEEGLKTSLALAFLDEHKNASYSFYKETLKKSPTLHFPETSAPDIVHFGSFFSLNPIIHNQLHKFLEKCRKSHSTILYDPNFRKPHLPELQKLMPLIESNLSAAHIVKASNDDLENIFGVGNPDQAWEVIKKYEVEILIYTMGEHGVWIYGPKQKLFVPSKKIDIISTIGAGDTFSAGIICYLHRKMKEGAMYQQFTMSQWQECLELATEFAAETCQSYDNYLSPEFAKKHKYVQ